MRGDAKSIHLRERRRIELWGDEVEKLSTFDPLTGDDGRFSIGSRFIRAIS
jgi:excinuclease UvrABC helicase subunit UvrB